MFLNQIASLPITLDEVGPQGPEKGRIAHIIDKNIGDTSVAKEGLIDREPHKMVFELKHGNKETTTLLFTAKILATAVAIPSKITP